MSRGVLRRDSSACRAWERRLHDGSFETRAHAALPGRAEFWLPLLMPAYGLAAWMAGAKYSSEWWIAILPWWILLGRGRLLPRVVPGEWEALHLPSRRAWLLARWSLRVPAWGWMGVCMAAYTFGLGMRDMVHPDRIRWFLLPTLFLAPLLVAGLWSWFTMVEARYGGRSWVPPLVALLISLGLLLLAIPIYVRKESGRGGIPIITLGLAALGVLILLLALPSLLDLVRRVGCATGRSRPRAALTVLRHAIVGIAGMVPASGITFAVMAGGSLVAPEGDPLSAGVEAALLALTLLGIALLLGESVSLIDGIDLGLEPPPKGRVRPARDRRDASAYPVGRESPGAGLRAAAWARFRGGWRNLPNPMLTFVPRALWECRAPVVGGISVAMLGVAPTLGFFVGMGVLWMGVIFPFLVPEPFRLPASRRLHLLGADFPEIARHNALWGLLLEVLPAAAGGSVVLFLPLGLDIPLAARLGGLLAATGILLFRTGLDTGWIPDVPVREGENAVRKGALALALLFAMFVAAWAAAPVPSLLAAGSLLFLVAAVLTVRILHRPEGRARVLEAEAVDD